MRLIRAFHNAFRCHTILLKVDIITEREKGREYISSAPIVPLQNPQNEMPYFVCVLFVYFFNPCLSERLCSQEMLVYLVVCNVASFHRCIRESEKKDCM